MFIVTIRIISIKPLTKNFIKKLGEKLIIGEYLIDISIINNPINILIIDNFINILITNNLLKSEGTK